MKSGTRRSYRLTHARCLALVIAWAVSGCSGSSQTDSSSSDLALNPSASIPNSGESSGNSLPLDSTTRVEFRVTVPVYQSNALQVQLEWGEIVLRGVWNVDELWTVVGDFPINTEDRLILSFTDRNGAITLGQYEADYSTGSGESELIEVSADQFITETWDDDNDGISNIDESIAGTIPEVDDTLSPVQANLALIPGKTFRISWQPTEGVEFYRILENPDGVSGFSPISEELDSTVYSFDYRIALYARASARYIVQSCDASRCVDSDELIVSGTLEQAMGYLKSSLSSAYQYFGTQVSLSADGNSLAVSGSGATSVFVRVNGAWQDEFTVATGSGAQLSADGNTMALKVAPQVVGIYTRHDSIWQEVARLQASNRGSTDRFGDAISLSGDGNTLAVGAVQESSAAAGINGDQNNDLADSSGAVYVYERINSVWQQQAYIKASNTESGDRFGASVSLSEDGNLLAVGASGESSAATGVNGDQSDNSIPASGAVFLFNRDSSVWQQNAYIKGTTFQQNGHQFGYQVALSADGDSLAVSSFDSSSTTGINGGQNDQTMPGSGAVFLFVQESGTWQQQAFLKASNTDESDFFGGAISLSGDGAILAVGAVGESSSARGVGGNQQENADYIDYSAGAVYLFVRKNLNWTQQAYLKASNTGPADEVCEITIGTSEGFFSSVVSGDEFGASVSMSVEGDTLAVGAPKECSAATGFNGNQADNSASMSGAVYLY